jgi:NAD(P)-dependent dehydrogenase (short-subunit alcohol dehydrogenase family)
MAFIVLLILLVGGIVGWNYYKKTRNAKIYAKYDVPGSYKGKVVLITGASSGIGKSIALNYARRGASIVLAARRAEQLQQVATQCKSQGAADVLTVATDVTREQDCKALIEQSVAKFGGLDILVLNAGRGALVDFEQTKNLDEYRELMDINYWGAVHMTFYSIAHLKQRHGKIVVISSITGKLGVPHRTAYAPTKFALHGFFDSLRLEVGQDVQITLICPGFVLSDFHEKAIGVEGENKVETQRERKFDAKNYMTPEQCAELIVHAEQDGTRELVMKLTNRLGIFAKEILPGPVLDYLIQMKEKSGFKEGSGSKTN